MTDVAEEIEADLLVAYMLADLDAYRQRDENKGWFAAEAENLGLFF